MTRAEALRAMLVKARRYIASEVLCQQSDYQIRGVKAPGFRHGDETPPASVNRRGKTVA